MFGSVMARLTWMSPAYRPKGPTNPPADSSELRFGYSQIRVLRLSICVRRTHMRTTSCVAITQHNTLQTLTGPGTDCEKRVPVSMSRGSIWKPENGHTCGLRFMEPTLLCM